MDDTHVERDRLVGEDRNDLTGRPFVLPVHLSIEPIERLLIASFKHDPEYDALEPQVFDDPVNGKGMRVLRYRRDKKVDVYWEPGVRVERDELSVGAGIGDFMETGFEMSRFEFKDSGVDLHVVFSDAQARRVELRVRETGGGNPGFPFLAPVGNEVERPRRLFLVDMLGFDFVRKEKTEITARIGDRHLSPGSFPIPRQFRGVHFIRYAAMPVIGVINPRTDRPSVFNSPLPGKHLVDGMTVWVDERRRVTRIMAGEGVRRAELEFSPGFADLNCLTHDAVDKGRWTFCASGTMLTGGTFILERKGSWVEAELDVTEPWKPVGLPFSFRVFTAIARSFRTWPSTYRWRGKIQLGEAPSLEGAWARKGGVSQSSESLPSAGRPPSDA